MNYVHFKKYTTWKLSMKYGSGQQRFASFGHQWVRGDIFRGGEREQAKRA